jgi:hypothetical protein
VRGGILGKTGTALVSEQGRYERGDYRASFAALYPARDPQLVVVVTIDRPRGVYYGGLTAAPVTADMLRQALAAKNSGLDKSQLGEVWDRATADRRPAVQREPASEPARVAQLHDVPARDSVHSTIVPDVAGRTVRAAVFALHQRGFRVRVEGTGTAVRTAPAAGDSLVTGRTVVLYAVDRTP